MSTVWQSRDFFPLSHLWERVPKAGEGATAQRARMLFAFPFSLSPTPLPQQDQRTQQVGWWERESKAWKFNRMPITYGTVTLMSAVERIARRCMCALALCWLVPVQAAANELTPSEDKAQRFPWLAHLPDGYLQLASPDSLEISPPPPAPDSLWMQLDKVIAQQALSFRGSARFEQARRDADLTFPASAQHFACTLGFTVNEAHTPTLYQMLLRIRVDAGNYAVYQAKQHYRRPRPFMLNGEPTCDPEHENALRAEGAYPSGHTTIGWSWALLLAELMPERTSAILQRARSYGHSRLVCNVHWYSDVLQGQALAASYVAALHGNAEFVRDLTQARREIATVHTLDLPVPHDCTAEAAALKQEIAQAR